ncbi:MAG: type I restriction endonuclease, partial [bacterium]|nr:type I restriction endonuclease [bacterium]
MDNTIFNTEAEFEQKVIEALQRKGWGEYEVIKYPTEEQLLKNWANILFENNRSIDRLGDYPLTDTEMYQIIEQINSLKTPLNLNEFINNTISITRDNPDDKVHFGKEISLKLYDRKEIAAGQSRYQIVQQPKFKRQSKLLNERRGDLMLLINGMPLIHIELKKSNVSVSQACNQIEKYAHEGIFSNGIFSLIQVFVAMEPKETVYFANPGPDGKFNKEFYFHWADANNEPVNNWDDVVENLLVIPMAHELIGFYTIADKSDGILKVMRSYQIYAARAISDCVTTHDWQSNNQLGGYVWHTTGSGKTMTSFKSAQLIASSKDADKVVFLVDRVELGTQSLLNYRAFATDSQSVQATSNTGVL